jgi:hypothetical protein
MRHRAERSKNDKYFELLAEKLMLDELLCGEEDPAGFLKRSICELRDDIKRTELEKELEKLRAYHEDT